MLADLAGGRLPHVNLGQLGAMCRCYRTFQIEQHGHPEVPRSTRWGQRRAARTGVAAPLASPIVVEPSVSSSPTIWAPRSAAGPARPARALGAAAAPVVSLTLSLVAESRVQLRARRGSRSQQALAPAHRSSCSSALASFRSGVSKPSVNQ